MPEILGQPVLVFSKLEGTENINGLFAYELEVKTPDTRNIVYGPAADLDMEAMQGRELTVEIELDGSGFGLAGGVGKGTREITGIVTDLRGPIFANDHIAYRMTLRPWLWLATLTTDYKIFQQKTVVEIAREVLADYNFSVENRLGSIEYPAREYQVQFGETDYQFVCRILSEFGISFFWEHSDGFHRMVLTDGNGAFRHIPSAAYQTISWYPSSDRVDEEHLYEFEIHDRLVSGQWTHGDYDHNQPRADLNVHAKDPRDTSHATQEMYVWPGDFTQPKTGNDAWKEGDLLARIRMEAMRQHGVRVRGKGNVRAMAPGHTFALKRFMRGKANREYLIYATHLLIEDVGQVTGSGQQWRCEVEFEAQPTSEIFRPERIEKPNVGGHCVARVVGPENQEIWCDNVGRVRVQFPWDRYGKNDANSSCWIRVADFASGDQFGSTHVPRIGQEVIVEFLGGDPDLPIIIGRVNNRLNLPPWNLPGQHALSGYRSKELFGGGHNYTVYDDTQGQQQVQVASDHQNSLLALGHNVRVPNAEGRKDKRGEGFELRTDAHGALRAALGMLVSTYARQKAQGNAMNLDEVMVLFSQILDMDAELAGSATKHGAQSTEQHDVNQVLEHQRKGLEGDKLPGDMTEPHLVLASPAGIASATPESTHIVSGNHTALSTGKYLSFSVGKSWVASVKQRISLYAQTMGIYLFARAGKINIQALSDAIDVIAKMKLRLISTEDTVEILSDKAVLVNGGGSFTKWSAEGIHNGTHAVYRVRSAGLDLEDPASMNALLPALATHPIEVKCAGLEAVESEHIVSFAPAPSAQGTAGRAPAPSSAAASSSGTAQPPTHTCTWAIPAIVDNNVTMSMESADYLMVDNRDQPVIDPDTGRQRLLRYGSASGTFDLAFDPNTKTITATVRIRVVPKQIQLRNLTTGLPDVNSDGSPKIAPYDHDEDTRINPNRLLVNRGAATVDFDRLKRRVENTLNQEGYKLSIRNCPQTSACSCRVPVLFNVEFVTTTPDSRPHATVNLFPKALRANSGNWGEENVQVDTRGRERIIRPEHVIAHEIGHLFSYPDEYYVWGGAVHRQYVGTDKSVIFSLAKSNPDTNTWRGFSPNNLMGNGVYNTRAETPPYYIQRITNWFESKTGRQWAISK